MEGQSNTDPSLPELLSGGTDDEDNEDQVEEEEETDTEDEDEASRNPNPIGSSPSPTPSLRPKPQAQPQTPTCSSPGPRAKNLIAFFTPSPQPKTSSPSPSPTATVVENSANPPSQQGFRHRAPSGAPPQAQGAEGRTRAEWLRQQKDAAELADEFLKKACEMAIKAEANARAPRGSMQDPATRIYASLTSSKLGRPITGKKTGICAGLKRNCRELGAPVLRRDPTAFEKLHMISDLERRVKEAGVSKPKELCMASRKAFEATN